MIVPDPTVKGVAAEHKSLGGVDCAETIIVLLLLRLPPLLMRDFGDQWTFQTDNKRSALKRHMREMLDAIFMAVLDSLSCRFPSQKGIRKGL